ncbi:hypothetical protein SCLCIDRAFT_1209248 [Scleroderma citrinum Foug A]|uniref:LysM domain-containing protein n=1 Tax=Scleroderma citrinum Foug A TaxID=1036808 RepID=A0A0C3EJL3_9AGAM|nr:hypothetical protein SCLCIDRAFT_1209248 [Scleroderma citrinum Foug A]
MVGCRSVDLCLACSSSLPPKAQNIFLTQCCTRPICPTCLSSNPRLGRYNPCLACLGGVDIVSSSSFVRRTQKDSVNIDGALRDDAMFVLGDDEEEDDGSSPADYAPSTEPPPSYTAASTKPSLSHPSNSSPVTPSGGLLSDQDTNAIVSEDVVPSIYHLSRGDTLQGIALRFGVNRHELCRLNNLPPSTLSTTPHLLHTRTSIKLPSSARLPPGRPASSVTEYRRVRERAEKRLQLLTKEADWHVAKAYVALADDPDEESWYAVKCKETGANMNLMGLEARALDKYLEDEEWEKEQSRFGKRFLTSASVGHKTCR